MSLNQEDISHSKRQKSRFSQFGNWIKGLFNKKNEEMDPDEEMNPQLHHHLYFLNMGEIFGHGKHEDRRLSNRFYQRIWEIGANFRKIGESDGAIGQNKIEKSLPKTLSEQIRDYVRAIVGGELAAAKIESEKRSKIHDQAFKSFGNIENYREELIVRKQNYPRKYSLGLAGLYLLIAFFLILADIPLALKLTQYGFALDFAEGDYAIKNLFSPQNIQDGAFLPFVYLKQMLFVFSNNWEVFVLSFGVALCTIYVKIFYDDFVGYPLDKAVTQFKNIPNVDPEDEKTISKIKQKYYARIAAKSFILILTVSTIFLLGLFRSETSREIFERTLKQEESSSQTDQQYDIFGSTDSSEEGTLDKFYSPYKEWSFIILTLIFPIIAGVCTSLGLDAIQNRREDNRTEKRFQKFKSEYIEALQKFTEATKREENWKEYHVWCTQEGFAKNYTEFFMGCYEHGYVRGVIEPDKDKDFYSKVEKLRDRLISTKTYAAVKRNNDQFILDKNSNHNNNI